MSKKEKKSKCIIDDSLLNKFLIHVGINAIVSSFKNPPAWLTDLADFIQ